MNGEGAGSSPVPSSSPGYLNRFANSESSTDEEGTWIYLYIAGAETVLFRAFYEKSLNYIWSVNSLDHIGFNFASYTLQLGSDFVPEEQSWDVILVVYIVMCPRLPGRQSGCQIFVTPWARALLRAKVLCSPPVYLYSSGWPYVTLL